MGMTSIVSIIIPSFNHRHYVEKAVNSVLNQTYNPIELIVIDDGSTDGSVELIEQLSNKYAFKFISQSNLGIPKTLNRGIKEFSSGKYIAILASDDYFEPTKIEKQVRALIEHQSSEFCYTQAIEFDNDSDAHLRLFPKKKFFGNVLNQIFLRQPYAAGSILFTRSLYDRLGGFDENLLAEDWDFSIRAASITSFIGVHEPLFYYRSHSNNTMKSLDRRFIFKEKARILSKNYLLVTPLRWLISIICHFCYDHGYPLFRHFNIKRLFR